ncbi:MAG: DUF1566 domain-containing protein [Pseudomonadota bacterium]
MKKAGSCFVLLLFSACLLWSSGCKTIDGSCQPGQKQLCYSPEGGIKFQSCTADGSGWGACGYTYYSAWCDNATALCWQDPQKDAYDPQDSGVTHADAVKYCEGLVFGGYDDWRLPTIDELRTLVRGNANTESDGECPLTEGSPMTAMNDPACAPIASYGGPGIGGCYWPEGLTGSCSRPDPASQGHPLEYMSVTACPDTGWYGVVMFDNSAVCWNHINTLADVRCVRNTPTLIKTCVDEAPCAPGETRKCTTADGSTGAQVCSGEGDCFGPCDYTAFKEAPPIKDVCPTCDSLQLTISVPDKLKTKPVQIMAFLYDAKTWTWPPNRPPDGGTSDDQVLNPVIDADKPLKLTVPGCTYYREKCLSGEYKLYVALMNSETMPPTMQEGDYWWGMDQEPITLGSNQTRVFEKEIMLVPWEKQ